MHLIHIFNSVILGQNAKCNPDFRPSFSFLWIGLIISCYGKTMSTQQLREVKLQDTFLSPEANSLIELSTILSAADERKIRTIGNLVSE